MSILKEARRLYGLGFACHWIKPGSKAPVKAGWSSPVRDPWERVKADYRKGFGLGVRMGESSRLCDGTFLANIDVDLKSPDKAHKKEALAVVRNKFPGVVERAPCVETGYGLRFFVRTAKPLQSAKVSSSPTEVKVSLPTSEVNRRQKAAVERGDLTADELARGVRIRHAWEVEFMSIGKQVVLPPSIHPDTGTPYTWLRGVDKFEDIPLVTFDAGAARERRKGGSGTGRESGHALKDFEPVKVVLEGRLSMDMVQTIKTGDGVDDRSAACFSAAMAMVQAGFSDQEILSVLTSRRTFLGETAYDHRGTSKRSAAAAWVKDYVLRKAKEQAGAAAAFADEVVEVPMLDEAGAAKQAAAVVRKRGWKERIERSGKHGEGPPRPTLKNVEIILTNAVAPNVFKLDTLNMTEVYGSATPWGGTPGAAITDTDAINVKAWLAEKWGFEPPVNLVFEAITFIAGANRFHPARDWLLGLPEWDGEERLRGWLRRNFEAKGDDAYLGQVFTKWLVASVTRIFEPGHKFDWMPIFEGVQGGGKSSFGSILFGEAYFADWLPRLDDKDAALGLQGRLCVEFGELASLRRNEIETIKAFVTRTTDKVRPPYGRKQVEIPRQVVFFGTTNRDAYLQDDTGNRRFNPVMVGKLNFKRLRKERDQLWAEALFLYENGLMPSLYLEGAAVEQAHEIREDKRIISTSDLMFECLVDAVEKNSEEFDFSRFRLPHLFAAMGPLNKWAGTSADCRQAAVAISKLETALTDFYVFKTKSKGRLFWSFKKHRRPNGTPSGTRAK